MAMLKFWVAVPATFVAVIVPVNSPEAVAVPVIAPALLSVSPVGKAPAVTENVGAGAPLAVTVKL